MKDNLQWTLKGGRTLGPAPFLVAGVLNITPDSFFDGGCFQKSSQAQKQADALLQEGADILDIGGESSRPFSRPVSEEEELKRVIPLIRELGASCPQACISVDTTKAAVAEKALQAGACIVNDISAYSYDPCLLDVLAQYKPGYVLMHAQGRPEDMQISPDYGNVLEEIDAFFERKLDELIQAGVPEGNIVLDPGIGFGKSLEHNLQILGGMERFTRFRRPLYVGLSNKSMWGKLLDLPLTERGTATQVGTALAADRGVMIHRVHDVRSAKQTLEIVQRMRSSTSSLALDI